MKVAWFSLYNIILALWVGGMALFTFIVTPVIFRSYSRDTAGDIVGRLFPGYFPYLLVLAALAFIVFFLVVNNLSAPAARISFGLLILALVLNAYVTFKLHPDAMKVRSQITSFERESPDSPARREFARLHAISASINLLLLADGIVLLVLGPTIRK